MRGNAAAGTTARGQLPSPVVLAILSVAAVRQSHVTVRAKQSSRGNRRTATQQNTNWKTCPASLAVVWRPCQQQYFCGRKVLQLQQAWRSGGHAGRIAGRMGVAVGFLYRSWSNGPTPQAAPAVEPRRVKSGPRGRIRGNGGHAGKPNPPPRGQPPCTLASGNARAMLPGVLARSPHRTARGDPLTAIPLQEIAGCAL